MGFTNFTRRQFIQTTAAGAAWGMAASSYARIMGSNQRLMVAYIGVGGIAGDQHIPRLEELGAGCPCYCDADQRRWENAANRWSDATGYTDYRQMYDRQHKDFDAVMVGTPDHSHYPATIIGMMLGKHAYTQKPLTHTVWEAQQLRLAMEKYKVATQMGNQGHASPEIRKTIDYVRDGAIGDVTEVHVWTDRPWWRQGIERPGGSQPVPDGMDWEAWIGPAPMRPFRHDPADDWGGLYHPFNWRGWWDFGCGALGDMACHEMDPFYWALDPGHPTSVELVDSVAFGDSDTYANESTVRYEFPAKGGRPAFTAYWYDGGRKPARPEEMLEGPGLQPEGQDPQPEGRDLQAEGALFIGTKGKMVNLSRGLDTPRLLPYSRHEEYPTPPAQLEPSPGHHKEWFLACTGEKAYDYPKSNFGYSGPFTETVLLGCIAQRVGGKLLFDGTRITNNDTANALMTKPYREGWDYKMS
jgi:predicted dehydrogenase